MVLDRLGRPLKDLRISVTDRCNFRCTYCMPAEIYGQAYQFLPKPDLLTFEEITRLVRVFVRLGTNKIRLTGGEPLLRQEIEKLVAMLARVEGVEDLTLTTNGFLLAQKAQSLKEAGLHRVSVSLDTLDDETFRKMNGRSLSNERVLEGIRKAAKVGLGPIKINAVVVRGVNDHTVTGLARYFKGSGHIIRFIEYMDVGNLNHWKLDEVVSGAEVIEEISREMALEPLPPNYRGEVASRFRYLDGGGEVGVINSVTQPFCGDCTRARLSPDGKLYTCLFAGEGRDLRGPLRARASDDELEELLRGVWQLRSDRYSEERAGLSATASRKVEMYQIGG